MDILQNGSLVWMAQQAGDQSTSGSGSLFNQDKEVRRSQGEHFDGSRGNRF